MFRNVQGPTGISHWQNITHDRIDRECTGTDNRMHMIGNFTTGNFRQTDTHTQSQIVAYGAATFAANKSKLSLQKAFVTLRKFVAHWPGSRIYPVVTSVTWPGTGADVINWFPPPHSKYFKPTVGAGVSVSCAKVCRSRSRIHLRPPTTQISELTNELETPGLLVRGRVAGWVTTTTNNNNGPYYQKWLDIS